MKILLATQNPGKINEYKKYLKYGPNLEIITLSDLNITDTIDETGRTFKENSLLKAKFFAEKTELQTIADDGGLEILALNNKPGVLSRRWPGFYADDKTLIEYTLEQMKNIPKEQRQAQMVAGLTFYDPNENFYQYFEAKIQGYIIDELPETYIPGLPFRSIFFLPQFNKLWQDITEEEEQELLFRNHLCNQFIQFLQQKYFKQN